MLPLKCITLSLLPVKSQMKSLLNSIKASHSVYNRFLRLEKKYFEEYHKFKEYYKDKALLEEYKLEKPWISTVDPSILECSLQMLENGITAYLQKRTKFPRMKSLNSLQPPKFITINNEVHIQDTCIYLPNIGYVEFDRQEWDDYTEFINYDMIVIRTTVYKLNCRWPFYRTFIVFYTGSDPKKINEYRHKWWFNIKNVEIAKTFKSVKSFYEEDITLDIDSIEDFDLDEDVISFEI